jgi:hypothetical protein
MSKQEAFVDWTVFSISEQRIKASKEVKAIQFALDDLASKFAKTNNRTMALKVLKVAHELDSVYEDLTE